VAKRFHTNLWHRLFRDICSCGQTKFIPYESFCKLQLTDLGHCSSLILTSLGFLPLFHGIQGPKLGAFPHGMWPLAYLFSTHLWAHMLSSSPRSPAYHRLAFHHHPWQWLFPPVLDGCFGCDLVQARRVQSLIAENSSLEPIDRR